MWWIKRLPLVLLLVLVVVQRKGKKRRKEERAAQQRQQQQETCYPLVAIKFASMSSEKMDGLSIGLVCSNLHDILENNDDFRARSSENAR